MGFLDFLFDPERKEQRQLAKYHKKVNNMWVQPSERQFILQELAALRNPEAVKVMLTRFDNATQNTTVDAEEKKLVHELLVDLADSTNDLDVIGLITEHVKKADEHVNWPMKVLEDLLSWEEMATLLTDLLTSCTTDYQRTPEKKHELILRAREFKYEPLATEVTRFLDDHDEGIRFTAVETLFEMGFDEISKEPMINMIKIEDSLRILQKLAPFFSEKVDWVIPEDDREDVIKNLPDGWGIHKKGHIYRRRS